MATADRVRPVLEDGLEGTGLVLEDVTVTPAGKRRVVRVLLDRDLGAVDRVDVPTEPLSLDEVADATRAVGDALDAGDVMGEQPYTLEVSSPGVGRPLTLPRHWQRNVGRLVTARTADGETTGRLVAATRTTATVQVTGTAKTPARTVELAYADVDRATVEVEFARHDDPKES